MPAQQISQLVEIAGFGDGSSLLFDFHVGPEAHDRVSLFQHMEPQPFLQDKHKIKIEHTRPVLNACSACSSRRKRACVQMITFSQMLINW